MDRPDPGPHPREGPARPPAQTFFAQAQKFLAPHQARFDALLSVVARENDLVAARLTGPGKTRRVMAAKREAVALAVETLIPPLNVETVGAFLELGRATVYRLAAEAKKLALDNPQFAARLELLRPRVSEALSLAEENLAMSAKEDEGGNQTGALGESCPTSERNNHHG